MTPRRLIPVILLALSVLACNLTELVAGADSAPTVTPTATAIGGAPMGVATIVPTFSVMTLVPAPTASGLLPTATLGPGGAAPTSAALPATAPPTSAGITAIKVFMIAMEDNGQAGPAIGCGDSVVAVTRQIAPTRGPLRAAFTELLSIKDEFYGQSGLYNPLYRYNLTLDEARIDNGRATIRLSGEFFLVGTCEDPRLRAQLEQTALQFSTVNAVDIYINDRLLSDWMDMSGE